MSKKKNLKSFYVLVLSI